MIAHNNIITTTISKNELMSIIDSIVTPFYNKIQSDNKVKNFIQEEMLFGLKIKQTKFVFKALTYPISELKNDLDHMNQAHKKIGLNLESFALYFFVWAELLLQWIKENKELNDDELEMWKLKLYSLLSHDLQAYVDIEHMLPPAVINEFKEILTTPSPSSEQTETSKLRELVQEIHEEQIQKRISASDFLQEFEFNPDNIDELAELESDAFDALYEADIIDDSIIEKITPLFLNYANILEHTYEFQELAFALNNLLNIMSDVKLETLGEKEKKSVHITIDGVMTDLKNWRINVFVNKDIPDVHYLDASLFSSIAQLEILLINHNSEGDQTADDEDDFELF